MSVTIRRAEPRDVADMLRLIVALAVNENDPDAVLATEESLTETLFGPEAEVFAHVVQANGRVEGVALWFQTYSTWTGRPSLYLEDLFVSEALRGTGTGRALFQVLAREAKERNCARIDWAVMDSNENAKAFYSRLGAHKSEGWEPWRIEGAALEALANG